MLLLGLLLFCILDWSYSQTDLCDKRLFSSYTHQSKRSVNYDETTTLSDRFMREGWYGSQDLIIPSVQPASGHCGAKFPIFLQSAPRVKRVIVDVKACIRDCITQMDIKALKCSDRLTIYKLVRPLNSGAAYCLDGIQTDLLDFNTNVTVNTNLRPVPGSDDEQEFIFDCSFPNPNQDSHVYKATWFVDDVMVYESNYTDYNDVNKIRSLTDTRLRDSNITTLGFQLHCDISAAVDTSGGRSSFPSTSRKKFIGMTVQNPNINLKEGEKGRISFWSTVPIGCAETGGCLLTVTADIPKEGEDLCEPTPTANEITSTVTENYGESVIQKKIFLRTDSSYFSHPIWQNYFLEPVTINIFKNTSLIEGRSCGIHQDPYLEDFSTTFW
ncbi:hypothetical protein LOTGIDRAFT_237274 [Lottia gigantea]|uniref:ZP domain-containing protein n=1 Tax=Lottia gigantea TaxID=225164 RepID=V4AKL4_LOTGI|nr:hypothetical protein LOTGIDRAFT_237274 [Lottia gigantea]ESP04744.1 hypothetical protein LOTGIDRAFT_237274 [Lottia gigantea]